MWRECSRSRCLFSVVLFVRVERSRWHVVTNFFCDILFRIAFMNLHATNGFHATAPKCAHNAECAPQFALNRMHCMFSFRFFSYRFQLLCFGMRDIFHRVNSYF